MTTSYKAGVDWVTATTQNERVGCAWMNIWHRHKDKLEGPVTAVRMHGFAGLKCEGMTWAQRETDGRFMVVASGQAAGELWPKLVLTDSRLTRVDLCVDCWLDQARPDVAKNIYRVLTSPAWDANRVKHTLFQSCGNSSGKSGQTLYCGSRSSQAMGRLYDKGLETKTIRGGTWWRYEVEYKAGQAAQISKLLRETDVSKYGAVIQGTVHRWFTDRFIGPLFDRGCTEGMHTATYVAKTTNEKRVAWLHTQVRPTVAYLFDVGLGEKVIEALGLSGLLSARELEAIRQAAKGAEKARA